MRKIKALFFVCIILFANVNIHIFQSWCHGVSIGYGINSKQFDSALVDLSFSQTEFKKDNCCKDVLIKAHNGSVFSVSEITTLSFPVFTGILPIINKELILQSYKEVLKLPQQFPNPPPKKGKLHKYYCQYTYYG